MECEVICIVIIICSSKFVIVSSTRQKNHVRPSNCQSTYWNPCFLISGWYRSVGVLSNFFRSDELFNTKRISNRSCIHVGKSICNHIDNCPIKSGIFYHILWKTSLPHLQNPWIRLMDWKKQLIHHHWYSQQQPCRRPFSEVATLKIFNQVPFRL